MRFGLVPDHAKAARPWARAVNIGPPPGLEDQVAFVEALVDDQTEFGRAFRVFAYPTPEELELIKAGRPIEFTVIAPQLVPISAQVY